MFRSVGIENENMEFFALRQHVSLSEHLLSFLFLHGCGKRRDVVRMHAGNLEAKILWLKNYERVQEIQQQIVWRPITELEPRAFIPEVQ